MKVLRLSAILFLTLGFNHFLNAAPPPPPTGNPTCWPPPCVPIDGGVTFLIAAGAAYGAKKIYDSRKKSQKSQ